MANIRKSKTYNLILVPNKKNTKIICYDNEFISPFENTIDLSFAQNDKYINIFGCFLQKKYGNLFKEDWCYFKKFTSETTNDVLNVEKCWDSLEGIDKNNREFTFEIHFFALSVLPKLFSQIFILYNNNTPKYLIESKINFLINEHFIYNCIKKSINNHFFINSDYSSYVYDINTNLYTNNTSLDETLFTLKKFLHPIKSKIIWLSCYVDQEYNQIILRTFLYKITSREVQISILDIIKNY